MRNLIVYLIFTFCAVATLSANNICLQQTSKNKFHQDVITPVEDLIAYIGWQESFFKGISNISAKLAKSTKHNRAFRAKYSQVNKIAMTTLTTLNEMKRQIASSEKTRKEVSRDFMASVSQYAAKQRGEMARTVNFKAKDQDQLSAEASGTICVTIMVDMKEACVETINVMQRCGAYRNNPMQLKKDQDKCGEKAQTWFVICSDAMMTAGGPGDFNAFDFQEEVARATANMMEMALQRCRDAKNGGKKKKPKKKVTGISDY